MGVDANRASGTGDSASAPDASKATVPLTEVAYGVRFVAPDFDAVHYGEYYDRIRGDFPERQTVGPIARAQSSPFGPSTLEIPAMPRMWFLQDARLVQLQLDRFIYNWRRLDASVERYPGFGLLFEEFQSRWKQFLEFTDASLKIPLTIEELSLTYINQLHDAAGSSPMFVFRNEDLAMPPPEFWVSQLQFAYPESNMRITVSARPAVNLVTQTRVTQLDMNVETISPPADKIENVFEWFDAAHALIHESFRKLLRTEWLDKWGFSSK